MHGHGTFFRFLIQVMSQSQLFKKPHWSSKMDLFHIRTILGLNTAEAGPFCVEFVCCPCVCIGFLWVLLFPPTYKYELIGWFPSPYTWPKALAKMDIIHCLIRSMPRHCWECIQAQEGHTHYWVAFWVAMIKFTKVGSACDCTFLLIGILNPALNGLIILVATDCS